MIITINTPTDYLTYRALAKPVYVPAKRKQQILIPCMNTLLVARDLVRPNPYNPNRVSDDKMELLRRSILNNGFAFPIVVVWDDEANDGFMIADGYHRWLISGPDWLGMTHVPVAVLDLSVAQLLVAIWEFNKARGVHQVDEDAELIRILVEQGMEEDEICTHLGVDLDTVYRYKQLTGIAELFKNTPYSMSWGVAEVAE